MWLDDMGGAVVRRRLPLGNGQVLSNRPKAQSEAPSQSGRLLVGRRTEVTGSDLNRGHDPEGQT